MAGVQFKRGNNANPRGAGAHNQVKKSLKKLTETTLIDIITQVLLVDPTHLKELSQQNPNVIKTTFAAALLNDINKGKTDTLSSLLDRLLGKPKDRVEMTGKDGGAIHTVNEIQAKAMIAKVQSEF